MQHENRPRRLTSSVALAALLGLALSGTPLIAHADESPVESPAPAVTVAAAAPVPEAARSSDVTGDKAPGALGTLGNAGEGRGATDDARNAEAPPAPQADAAPAPDPAADPTNPTDQADRAATGEGSPQAPTGGKADAPAAGDDVASRAGDGNTRDPRPQAVHKAEASGPANGAAAVTALSAPSPSAGAVVAAGSDGAATPALAAAEALGDKAPMYRLYNRYSGEHLFSSSSAEAEHLISIGWTGESVAWFTPGESSKPVWRLYNPYSGDHHYTTDASERQNLIRLGWSDEDVGFYSDEAEATRVYRLFNPYATVATHHYTTSKSEYDYLGSIGWRQEWVGWHGAGMPADGWYVAPAGDELLVSGGGVRSDAVVENEDGEPRYLTPAGFVAKDSTWASPSSGYTYVTARDGTITRAIAPNSGLDHCWLRGSPYWSGAGVVKELLLDRHYSTGRFGQSISKIVIHHNGGNSTTEGVYSTWQTNPVSAHYQVEANGTVGQLVLDSNTAWHAGNWAINTKSIGVEHADYMVSRDEWRMTEATISSGARLVAALCLQYKLGRPQWGVNMVGHNECSATECPASLAVGGSQHDEYVAKAQGWYDRLSRL